MEDCARKRMIMFPLTLTMVPISSFVSLSDRFGSAARVVLGTSNSVRSLRARKDATLLASVLQSRPSLTRFQIRPDEKANPRADELRYVSSHK